MFFFRSLSERARCYSELLSFNYVLISPSLGIGMRSKFILRCGLQAMTEYHLRICPLLKHVNELVAALPIVVITSEPSLGNALVVVLMDMVPTRRLQLL